MEEIVAFLVWLWHTVTWPVSALWAWAWDAPWWVVLGVIGVVFVIMEIRHSQKLGS